MNKKLTITSDEVRQLAIEIIEALPIEPVHQVIIKPHKKDRSLAQNGTYWRWLTQLASEYGDSKEDRHRYYKEKYLVNIYFRDDEDYRSMVLAIKALRKAGMTAEYESIKNQVIDLTSTSKASVKQFSEYLDNIEKHAASIGVGFIKDDQYKEAMNI